MLVNQFFKFGVIGLIVFVIAGTVFLVFSIRKEDIYFEKIEEEERKKSK